MHSFDWFLFTSVRKHIVTHHGVIPIMEMLEIENPNREVILAILRVVNKVRIPPSALLKPVLQMIENNKSVQENLCLVGGIPIIMKFANHDYQKDVRLEAANFLKTMYTTSTMTLQMLIACRGEHHTAMIAADMQSSRPSRVGGLPRAAIQRT